MDELEFLMGPEDSEDNLRYILTHAGRMGSRSFEIFSTREKSEHLVASKLRWEERHRQRVVQEERARRSV